MVCDRCIESVRQIFQEEKIPLRKVELGRVETGELLEPEDVEKISARLTERGFGLVTNREQEIIEMIKVQMIEYLRYLEWKEHPHKFSGFLTKSLHYNYSYLSKLFSDRQGETIENYLIRLKIERVKELLGQERHTLSEIAWRLRYSSVQYLSNQFKRVTGMTVTEWQSRNHPGRTPLDMV